VTVDHQEAARVAEALRREASDLEHVATDAFGRVCGSATLNKVPGHVALLECAADMIEALLVALTPSPEGQKP